MLNGGSFELNDRAFQAFEIGWRSFERDNDTLDEAIVKGARQAVGPEALLMVDADGSDPFLTPTPG